MSFYRAQHATPWNMIDLQKKENKQEQNLQHVMICEKKLRMIYYKKYVENKI